MTPSLEGWPFKAKEVPSPHGVRLTPLDTSPVFQCLGKKQASLLHKQVKSTCTNKSEHHDICYTNITNNSKINLLYSWFKLYHHNLELSLRYTLFGYNANLGTFLTIDAYSSFCINCCMSSIHVSKLSVKCINLCLLKQKY